MNTLILSFLGIIAFVLVFNNWKKALIALVIIFPIEYFIRKFVYDSVLIYLVKDVIFIFIFSGYIFLKISKNRGIFSKTPVNVPIAVFFGLSIIELLNPNLANIFAGLVGLKTIFLYMPIFYLTRYTIKSKEEISSIFIALILFSIPVSILAILQYFTGPFSSLNIGAAGTQTPYASGEFLRPTGIFLHTGGFGQYLYFSFLIAFATLLLEKRGSFKHYLALISLPALLISLLLSGQRASMTLLLLQIPLMAYLINKKFNRPNKYIKIFTLLGIIFYSFFVIYPKYFGPAFERFATIFNFRESIEQERIKGTLLGGLAISLSESPIFGHGIGSASLGARYVFESFGVESNYQYMVEGGVPKIAWELGLPGLLVYFWLMISILKLTLNILKRTYDLYFYGILLFILMFQTGCFIWNFIAPVFDNALMSIYFWFLSGIVLWVGCKNKEIKIYSNTEKQV